MERPDILLMLQEGLPNEIEVEVRTQLDRPGLKLAVIRHPGGPFAGVELYLPTAIGLFVAAGFFNGVLQEAGKDAYVAFKEAASALWKQATKINVSAFGSAGKVAPTRRYSLAYSITGEILPGLNFKFLVQTEVKAEDAETGIVAFIDLINDILNDRVGEDDLKALLTYRPVGGTVLVTFDAVQRMIVPVNAFDGKGS